MGDVTFNKGKWRDIKKAEFRKSLKNSMLGKHDKIVDKICDWHSSMFFILNKYICKIKY
ncbi:hypothetical protein [Campylobacter ureolyticus]|uniref:hypothetical protein n=1 Tax=Campylobacter ureolyticus TaxID=827 RepID=UPI001FC7DC2A|nr:hypothetical protein [Campylobacter ureolyticus]MCZ6105376.1 hypothetical protein [Campylobacter ureolyticus]MCZ6132601.1 hypothetical protein [Campylobacter ureolyticus]MCZ6158386.1 hypothetical protein [Campylobacter ureolyticus]GKH60467.1 hypothetical protein CE91St25_08030 [Campylobacter ureolyticus]